MTAQTLQTNDKSIHSAIDQVLKNSADKPEARALIARTLKATAIALNGMIDDLPKIKGINSAVGSELIALVAEQVLSHDTMVPKRALLKLRGQMAFREQLVKAGGVYSTQEVAELLGTSVGAIRKRAERNTMIAIASGGQLQFPVWQFSETGTIDGLVGILTALNTTAVSAIQFLLTSDEDLGTTPLEAIKGANADQMGIVALLAKQWQQQVAR